MSEIYYLEKEKNIEKISYNIIDELEKIEDDKHYNMKINLKAEIEKLDQVIKLKMLNEDKDRCVNNVILDTYDNLERDNNEYILKYDKKNNLKFINRHEIEQNIEQNLFKYFKYSQGHYKEVHNGILLYKQIMLESEYFENLLARDSSISYLFLDIYEKEYSNNKKTNIRMNIGNILKEIIPVILEFNIEEMRNGELKLTFNLKLKEKNLLISKLKDFYEKKIYEKFEFKIEENGYYVINLKNKYIKEIYVEKELVLDTSKSLRKIRINTIGEHLL